MKQIWTGRITQAAAKYGEITPAASTCCNTCRTCATTNLLSLGIAGLLFVGNALRGITKRR